MKILLMKLELRARMGSFIKRKKNGSFKFD